MNKTPSSLPQQIISTIQDKKNTALLLVAMLGLGSEAQAQLAPGLFPRTVRTSMTVDTVSKELIYTLYSGDARDPFYLNTDSWDISMESYSPTKEIIGRVQNGGTPILNETSFDAYLPTNNNNITSFDIIRGDVPPGTNGGNADRYIFRMPMSTFDNPVGHQNILQLASMSKVSYPGYSDRFTATTFKISEEGKIQIINAKPRGDPIVDSPEITSYVLKNSMNDTARISYNKQTNTTQITTTLLHTGANSELPIDAYNKSDLLITFADQSQIVVPASYTPVYENNKVVSHQVQLKTPLSGTKEISSVRPNNHMPWNPPTERGGGRGTITYPGTINLPIKAETIDKTIDSTAYHNALNSVNTAIAAYNTAANAIASANTDNLINPAEAQDITTKINNFNTLKQTALNKIALIIQPELFSQRDSLLAVINGLSPLSVPTINDKNTNNINDAIDLSTANTALSDAETAYNNLHTAITNANADGKINQAEVDQLQALLTTAQNKKAAALTKINQVPTEDRAPLTARYNALIDPVIPEVTPPTIDSTAYHNALNSVNSAIAAYNTAANAIATANTDDLINPAEALDITTKINNFNTLKATALNKIALIIQPELFSQRDSLLNVINGLSPLSVPTINDKNTNNINDSIDVVNAEQALATVSDAYNDNLLALISHAIEDGVVTAAEVDAMHDAKNAVQDAIDHAQDMIDNVPDVDIQNGLQEILDYRQDLLNTTDIPKEGTFTNLQETTTGLDDVKIYPNPSTDHIQIKLPDNLPKANYFITSISGQQVMSGETMSNTAIYVQHLPSGIYLVHLQADNTSKTIKIIKQ